MTLSTRGRGTNNCRRRARDVKLNCSVFFPQVVQLWFLNFLLRKVQFWALASRGAGRVVTPLCQSALTAGGGGLTTEEGSVCFFTVYCFEKAV
jgi:hypothetical protein